MGGTHDLSWRHSVSSYTSRVELHKTVGEKRNNHRAWKWDIVSPLPVGSRHHTEIAAEPVGVVPWQLGLRFDVTTIHHSNRPRLPVTA
ncbi:hypothetical protein QQF64_028693 [Cirrhinus molitorella]|uniref:Uncharacterized protein n=1 Tax=Cirrhinus molitorella TaxID=172907 RepID=A0ABR3N7E6_9TELE